jgi:hypothetical protein
MRKEHREYEEKFKRLKKSFEAVEGLVSPTIIDIATPSIDNTLSNTEFNYLINSILEKFKLVKSKDEEYLFKANRTKRDIHKILRADRNKKIPQTIIFSLLKVNSKLNDMLTEQSKEKKAA